MLAANAADQSRLPRPLTPLIGRERELVDLSALLGRDDVRLVTLIGPGGVGKTRLALAVAEQVQPAFPDGVVYVPLQAVTDPALALPTIAQALGVQQVGERSLLAAIGAFLEATRLLLVLDNFEQLLPAAGSISELLAACPTLKVLVTSRAVLNLYGEHDVLVEPLALADPQRLPELDQLAAVAAIQLFVERAQAARAGFALSAENAQDVAAICGRLEGVPLALEIAAARLRMFAPRTLLGELDHQLRILTGGPRDLPARQQTVRDTIAWSYALLTAEQQRLLRQLGVFVGGWTLAAARAVCDADIDVLGELAALVDQSLVRQSTPAADAERFSLLEMMREFALEQLEAMGEAGPLRERHASYFAELAGELGAKLNRGEQHPWLEQLDSEQANVRSALGWLREQADVERGLRLIGQLREFWFMRGQIIEALSHTAWFLAFPEAATPTAARALALGTAAWIEVWRGNNAVSLTHSREALDIWEALGEHAEIPHLHVSRGLARGHGGEQFDGAAYWERGLALAREQGDALSLIRSMGNLAEYFHQSGESALALAHFEEALTLARATDNQHLIGLTLWELGSVEMAIGRPARAVDILQESLLANHAIGLAWGVVMVLVELAHIAGALGQPERSARLLGASEAIFERVGMNFTEMYLVLRAATTAALQTVLTADAFDAALAAGRAMTMDEAVAEALLVAVSPAFADATSPPAADNGVRHPLSPRELDVLRLLVDGRSNQEIANELFISSHTVAAHVANILNKLGVDSRTAAATWAVRHGIC